MLLSLAFLVVLYGLPFVAHAMPPPKDGVRSPPMWFMIDLGSDQHGVMLKISYPTDDEKKTLKKLLVKCGAAGANKKNWRYIDKAKTLIITGTYSVKSNELACSEALKTFSRAPVDKEEEKGETIVDILKPPPE